MGILKFLFVGIFVSFPLGVLVRISITPQAYVYPVDFFVILFVLLGIYFLLEKKKKVRWLGHWKYFVIVALISLVVNYYWLDIRELFVSSLYLVRLLFYLLLIPIISQMFSKKDVRWLLTIIASSLMVTVIIGFAQYYLYPDLRNLMYLGWDEHLYRIFSSFLDPNFASVIFVILFWLIISLTQLYKSNRAVSYALVVSLLLTGIAILLTYSRTGYVAWLGSAVVYAGISKNIRVMLLFVAIMVIGILLLPKDFKSEGVDLFRTASIFSRVDAYDQALQIAQKNLLLGVGFNSYRYAQDRYVLENGNLQNSHAGAGVSNSYLFIFVTTGIIGLVAFIYAIWKTAGSVLFISPKHLRNSIVALLSTVIFGSISENILFYSFILIVVSCVVGISALVTERSGQ